MDINRAVILVAEDEETDAILLCRAFKRAGLPHRLALVRNGEEAVAYLRADPPFDNREEHPFPCLVLLDLKMPRMNGFDLLRWIRTQPEFVSLPSVVFTSSSSEADREAARQLGASEYIVKPHAFADLLTTVCELHARWLDS